MHWSVRHNKEQSWSPPRGQLSLTLCRYCAILNSPRWKSTKCGNMFVGRLACITHIIFLKSQSVDAFKSWGWLVARGSLVSAVKQPENPLKLKRETWILVSQENQQKSISWLEGCQSPWSLKRRRKKKGGWGRHKDRLLFGFKDIFFMPSNHSGWGFRLLLWLLSGEK